MRLHVYGQGAWHDPVTIVGDAEALRLLGHACLDAWAQGWAATHANMTNDGEGYSVFVVLDDCSALPVPYSEDMAQDHNPGRDAALRRLIRRAAGAPEEEP